MLRTSDNKVVNPYYMEKMWTEVYKEQFRVKVQLISGSIHYLETFYDNERDADQAIESIVTRYWNR